MANNRDIAFNPSGWGYLTGQVERPPRALIRFQGATNPHDFEQQIATSQDPGLQLTEAYQPTDGTCPYSPNTFSTDDDQPMQQGIVVAPPTQGALARDGLEGIPEQKSPIWSLVGSAQYVHPIFPAITGLDQDDLSSVLTDEDKDDFQRHLTNNGLASIVAKPVRMDICEDVHLMLKHHLQVVFPKQRRDIVQTVQGRDSEASCGGTYPWASSQETEGGFQTRNQSNESEVPEPEDEEETKNGTQPRPLKQQVAQGLLSRLNGFELKCQSWSPLIVYLPFEVSPTCEGAQGHLEVVSESLISRIGRFQDPDKGNDFILHDLDGFICLMIQATGALGPEEAIGFDLTNQIKWKKFFSVFKKAEPDAASSLEVIYAIRSLDQHLTTQIVRDNTESLRNSKIIMDQKSLFDELLGA
ncbi:hypothetical protein F53441_5876 [Fusarium austroafricanum]|uniref:Uncharacterized protein n=1 Tax=Fusarium austroafricanum TaxID=2364996 RepID=A0A8H4P069_9HYPO|nr:hypothetical protein F53441_5876 [Fusarium austroafricanum]